MTDLNNINEWQKSFGLLPIKLFIKDYDNNFILHNGGKGDFCIEINSFDETKDYNSFSWSSNTSNYVTLKENSVSLYNWKETKKDKEIIERKKL